MQCFRHASSSTLISPKAGYRQAGIGEMRNFCSLQETYLALDLEVNPALRFFTGGDHASRTPRAGPYNSLRLYKFTHVCIWICSAENVMLCCICPAEALQSHLHQGQSAGEVCATNVCPRVQKQLILNPLAFICVKMETLLDTYLSALSLRSPVAGVDVLKQRSLAKSRYRCWGATVPLQDILNI